MWFNNIVTGVSLVVVVLVIILGSTKVDPDNWQPFLPFGLQGRPAGRTVWWAALGRSGSLCLVPLCLVPAVLHCM